MYSPVTRLLLALDLLQSRPSITAAQLAERLEVSPRSVRRYVVMLQDLGIPVEAERGRAGGYCLRPGYRLPPLMWTEEEALAITLGLRAARQLELGIAPASVEQALAKVERTLPLAVREQVQATYASVTFDLDVRGGPPGDVGARLALLSSASYQQFSVQMEYKAHNGTPSERRFDCYGMVFRHDRWYALGYCHLRRELRVFRLDRVNKVALTADTFRRPAGFDALAYLLESAAALIPGAQLVEVLLDAQAEQLQDVALGAAATIEETANGLLLRAYQHDLDLLARRLAGMGIGFNVVAAPPEFGAALRRLAQQLISATQPIGQVSG